MSANLIRSSRLFPDAPYACASAAHSAGLIFTAGACPLDEHGQVTSLGDHDAPSTLLGVAVLDYPGQLVEIEAVAAAAR